MRSQPIINYLNFTFLSAFCPSHTAARIVGRHSIMGFIRKATTFSCARVCRMSATRWLRTIIDGPEQWHTHGTLSSVNIYASGSINDGGARGREREKKEKKLQSLRERSRFVKPRTQLAIPASHGHHRTISDILHDDISQTIFHQFCPQSTSRNVNWYPSRWQVNKLSFCVEFSKRWNSMKSWTSIQLGVQWQANHPFCSTHTHIHIPSHTHTYTQIHTHTGRLVCPPIRSPFTRQLFICHSFNAFVIVSSRKKFHLTPPSSSVSHYFSTETRIYIKAIYFPEKFIMIYSPDVLPVAFLPVVDMVVVDGGGQPLSWLPSYAPTRTSAQRPPIQHHLVLIVCGRF